MTLVDVCGNCGTKFDEDDESCRRCGTDRKDAIKREMRDLCNTYTGEEPEDHDIARIVKPMFIPKWGKAQWYELGEGEAPDEGPDEGADDAVASEGDAEAEVEEADDGVED
ncbi:MAG: hypothetical protein KAS77_08295 [Thermoplasmata archaeon]|nr:hypothetical protein [Thermoplasmata archaeon]